MVKKILASLLVVTLLALTVMPVQSYAAPKWWERFKDIVAGDIVGAADGYFQTETIGGAIAGGIKGSIEAANGSGTSGQNWPIIDMESATLGDLHNEGLGRVYERFQFNSQELSKESWERIDRTILTYIWEQGLYNEDIGIYLKGMDPTFEAIMRRIKDSAARNEKFPVSVNFYSNLEKALAILDGEADDPQVLIDGFVKFLVDAAAKESGEELTLKNGGLSYGEIKITYKPQKSMENNNDIIVAQIMAATARKSYDYWKSRSDGMDGSSNIPEVGVPEIVESDIPPVIRGLEIAIDRLEAKVGIDPVVLDVAPFIENDRTMVPFRFVGESLGAEIGWDSEESSVSYVLGDNTVKLYIGKNIATINGKEVPIDDNPLIVARIVNSRTVVPVRFISEALGFKVSWDPDTRTVGIITNPYFVNDGLSGDMIDN